ncbi:hypothetical protein AB5J62_14185 [Amycolatopsis sp. cg5]|uniref:hypothetical protein n=1 Tax=Amycolatopsis sp. cg5 TaxID=3238802 RepID=UPI0035235DFF
MVRKGEWADNFEALYSQSRYGVITIARLIELGVPRKTCYDQCKPGRPWRLLLRGIVLLGSSAPTRRQLVEAALLYAPEGSVVTGNESCRSHGLLKLPSHDRRVHVLIPGEHQVSSAEFVLTERTNRVPEPVMREGMPLAPVARSVLDACRRMRARDPIAALVSEAVQRAELSPAELLEELAKGSNRGSALVREVLLKVHAGARSVAEIDAMSVWHRTKLPEPLWNFELRTERGEYIGTPDGWFEKVGLAWEIDSYDYHFDRAGYAKTLERNARYAAAGINCLQTTPSRLRSEPVLVAAELVAAHLAASLRPLPSVLVVGRRG